MQSTTLPLNDASIHPVHSLLLALPVTLLPGTFIADLAYARTAEIQWSNFAQWLNAAGLAFGGLAGAAAIASYIKRRGSAEARQVLIYGGLLAGALGTGLVNAFIHARDAWGMMPDALWWSGVSGLLVLGAAWVAWSGFSDRSSHRGFS